MSDKKSSTEKCGCKDCKCENCNCGRSLMPICFLVCALTAVLVALIFSISFTAVFTTELRHKYGRTYAGTYVEEYSNSIGATIVPLSAGATIDMFESGATGFLMIGEKDDERSDDFYAKYSTLVGQLDKTNEFFVYTHNAKGEDAQAENYARAITLDTENAPALLYIRNGKIYDRLDSLYDDSVLNTFIMKYKAVPSSEE